MFEILEHLLFFVTTNLKSVDFCHYVRIDTPAIFLSAYYIRCIFSNTLQKSFLIEVKTLNPDQTASYGSILFTV